MWATISKDKQVLFNLTADEAILIGGSDNSVRQKETEEETLKELTKKTGNKFIKNGQAWFVNGLLE